MVLLGHEDVDTTLHYMQSDPAFMQEVKDVLREVRIIRMTATISDMRAVNEQLSSLANAGYGGGGAPGLMQAIQQFEGRMHSMGVEWGVDTARELAVMLTDNGQSARLIAPGVMCTKSPGEVGMCNQRRGDVTPGNCKVECPSHIELAAGRRDVERVIPILVEQIKALESTGLLGAAHHGQEQLRRELSRYDDIGQNFSNQPEVQAVLKLDLQWGT
jgi:hypothetical protein